MTRRYRKAIPKDKIHIPLIDLDFRFQPEEVERVEEMWKEGYDIRVISKELNREGDEIMVLLLDLARKDRIVKRENSVWGTRL